MPRSTSSRIRSRRSELAATAMPAYVVIVIDVGAIAVLIKFDHKNWRTHVTTCMEGGTLFEGGRIFNPPKALSEKATKHALRKRGVSGVSMHISCAVRVNLIKWAYGPLSKIPASELPNRPDTRNLLLTSRSLSKCRSTLP